MPAPAARTSVRRFVIVGVHAVAWQHLSEHSCEHRSHSCPWRYIPGCVLCGRSYSYSTRNPPGRWAKLAREPVSPEDLANKNKQERRKETRLTGQATGDATWRVLVNVYESVHLWGRPLKLIDRHRDTRGSALYAFREQACTFRARRDRQGCSEAS